MEKLYFKLIFSQAQYDKLVETISRANALTQVILAMPTDNMEMIPSSSLYDFLMVLDSLTYEANELCHTVKPQLLEHTSEI